MSSAMLNYLMFPIVFALKNLVANRAGIPENSTTPLEKQEEKQVEN